VPENSFYLRTLAVVKKAEKEYVASMTSRLDKLDQSL
jgi:hypothetical protein